MSSDPIEVLRDLRVGVEMDAAHDPQGPAKLAAIDAAIAALSAPQPPARMASIPESSPNGWLQAGGLLYRLTEGHRPENRDEIYVTMVHGSRDPAHCEARASEILAMLQSQPPAKAQAQGGGEAELRRMVTKLAAHVRPTCGELWAEAERLLNRTEPPSAPVGVGYAKRLATWLWQQHYREDAPQWEPCDDLMGLLSQIDNMVSGLTRSEALAQQPVAVDAAMVKRALAAQNSWPCPEGGTASRGMSEAQMRFILSLALAVQQGGES